MTNETGSGQASGRRARVLLESTDAAVGDAGVRILREEGYDAEACGGPSSLPRKGCPLVTRGDCPLSADADVIVHALNPGHPENAAVLRALRARHPTTPVIVEIPEPAIPRFAELLQGCEILPMPMTKKTLVQAVGAALGGSGSGLE